MIQSPDPEAMIAAFAAELDAEVAGFRSTRILTVFWLVEYSRLVALVDQQADPAMRAAITEEIQGLPERFDAMLGEPVRRTEH